MKFSMNGFRRQLSGDIETLRDLAQEILNDGHYDKDEFIEAVNDVIRHSNVLNCVYHAGDQDFVDMSEVEVDLLKE